MLSKWSQSLVMWLWCLLLRLINMGGGWVLAVDIMIAGFAVIVRG
jgi:hypothetical protein